MTNIEAKLDAFDLHDLPVKGLCLNFKDDNIQFIFEFYNDELDNYVEKIFLFKNVKNIIIPQISHIDYNELELTSYTLTSHSDFEYKIELIFLLGFGKPSWSIYFDFSELEIVDELIL